jgi:tetratricopeptide (TPR) repeat protein
MQSQRFTILAVCLLWPVLGCGPAWSQSQPSAVDRLYAEARAFEARGDVTGAISKYNEILKAAPSLAAAYNNLGALYFDSGQYRNAIEVLQAGLRLNPRMAPSYAVLGSAYLALGDSNHAIAAFKSAVKENPKDLRSEDQLEQSLIAVKDYSSAADRVRARVQRDPGDQEAWYRLGNIYLQLSQEAHSKALALDPDSAVALDLQGEIQEGMGNFPKAQAKYEAAVKAAPEKPGTHEHLGNIYWIQGQWALAQVEFQAELVNDPGSCRSRWKVANCRLNQNEGYPEALSDLNAAVERCPDLMQARVDRARTFVQLGRAAEGLDDLLLAEKDSPREPSIHFLLSKVYRAQGKPAEASAELQLFSKLVDQNKHLTDAGPAAVAPSPPN